ncbi:MAG: hypothetical protein HUJ98_15110, partial [Bacteroidaceae bacterium]|nr:hypothetical protein [Bacteroidaceae bacterium]
HLYNGMNKASDELEKLYLSLQNKEPAATQQDMLDKLPQLTVLSSLAFDLNQEAGRSAIIEGFKGVVSEEQIAKSEKRARLLGGIAYGIYDGLNAKSQCYRNVLGEGNNSPFFVISGALHWQFTRNNLMKKVAEDLNRTGKISEKLIESYHDVACNFTGLVDLHRETKNMISDFPVSSENDPMVQAAFLPVAIAIHDGTEPNVAHISANNFVIEGVDKLAKRVKKSMQENRQQAQKNNAPEAKQEQKKGPQMV